MVCKICNNENAQIVGKPRFNARFPITKQQDYDIMQCTRCGYYFLKPELDLSQEEWSGIYEDSYFAGANITQWHRDLRERERRYRLDSIQKHLGVTQGRFLDFGCGEGFVLNEAISRGYNAFGVDIAVNLDSSVNRGMISFYKGNIVDAKYPDNYFQAIYMDSALEHIADPLPILRELRRILIVGGVLLIIVPNEDCLLNDAIKVMYTLARKKHRYGRIKPFVSPYHVHGFNETSLITAVNKAGFALLEMVQFGGNYAMWKAQKLFSKSFFKELLLFPFHLLSIPLKKQIQMMVLLTKTADV